MRLLIAVQEPNTQLHEGEGGRRQEAVADDEAAAAFCIRVLPAYGGDGCQIPTAERPRFMGGSRTVAATPAAAGGAACTLVLPDGATAACTFVPCHSRLQAGWEQVHAALQPAPGDVMQFSQEASSAGRPRFRVLKLPRPVEPAVADRQPRSASRRPPGHRLFTAAALSADGMTSSWRLAGSCTTVMQVAAAVLNAWGVHSDTVCDLVLPGGQWTESAIRRHGGRHGAFASWANVARQLQPHAGDTITMRAASLEPLELHLRLTRPDSSADGGAEAGGSAMADGSAASKGVAAADGVLAADGCAAANSGAASEGCAAVDGSAAPQPPAVIGASQPAAAADGLMQGRQPDGAPVQHLPPAQQPGRSAAGATYKSADHHLH